MSITDDPIAVFLYAVKSPESKRQNNTSVNLSSSLYDIMLFIALLLLFIIHWEGGLELDKWFDPAFEDFIDKEIVRKTSPMQKT